MTNTVFDGRLRSLVDGLIGDLTRVGSPIREGVVMTTGERLPYRRLDCDGRALAYVRTRQRKGLVRIDVSVLWAAPRRPAGLLPTRAGTISIAVRTEEDRTAAVDYLAEIVTHTRAIQAAREARREQQRMAQRKRPPKEAAPAAAQPEAHATDGKSQR